VGCNVIRSIENEGKTTALLLEWTFTLCPQGSLNYWVGPVVADCASWFCIIQNSVIFVWRRILPSRNFEIVSQSFSTIEKEIRIFSSRFQSPVMWRRVVWCVCHAILYHVRRNCSLHGHILTLPLKCRWTIACSLKKVRFFLYKATKAQMGVEVYSSSLPLISALGWRGWSTPRPGRFTPRKQIRYPLYRRLGGSQGRSGRAQKTGIRSPDRPASNIHYTDWAIPAGPAGFTVTFHSAYLITST
jgi:hypothetical protein